MDMINSNGFRCDEHWNRQIELCLGIAVKAHAGQIDKVGLPVIQHPLHVGQMGDTPLEVCIGFLHDDSVSYLDYIQALIDSDNHAAIEVKLNDLNHNLERAMTYGFSKQYQKCEKAIKLIESSCSWIHIKTGKKL